MSDDHVLDAALQMIDGRDAVIVALRAESERLLEAHAEDMRLFTASMEILRAQVAEMRDALKPFADVDCEGDEDFQDRTDVIVLFGRSHHCGIKLGDFRRARAALEMSGGMK